ncbi:MAG: flagellar hook assembly protein FlgD [Alphaproteobacteria bacterium]
MTTTSTAVTTMNTQASQAAAPNAAVGGAAAAQKKFNQDMGTFLNLLTTQLKFQDPLSPMDSTQFTNQLVQFSSVEQQVTANSNLEKLIALQKTNQTSAALSYLGQTVEADTTKLPLVDGQANLTYTIPSQVNTATVTVRDSSGAVVYNTSIDNTVGQHDFTWKGTDNFGFPQKDGAYEVSITATDASGASVPVATRTLAKVTGVSSSNGTTQIALGGGIEIDLSKVLGVTLAPQTKAAASDSLLDKLTSAFSPSSNTTQTPAAITTQK